MQELSADSTSTETDVTTSIEARPNEKLGESVSPKSTSMSRSSTDISSEILNESDHEHQDQRRVSSPPMTDRIHNHLLPSGWSCKYSPKTDEYSFEYDQNLTQGEPGQAGLDFEKTFNNTPTRDDTAQTSRRPTLHIFECNYGYHFPTSPTSSMISNLARQVQNSSAPLAGQKTTPKVRLIGYGKHKLVVPTEDAEQVRRLSEMFPTATQPVIEQMIQIYHGREGLIKAALISLGYKRATEYNVQQSSSQSPIMLMMSKPASKRLFDKLVGYFPDKEENYIKQLMYRHKEVEHEIISALVESDPDAMTAEGRDIDSRVRSRIERSSCKKSNRNGTIMKLRYLKFLYPTCQELELYHLLNCNDLNVQKVMDLVEKRGHKRINIEEVLKSRNTQMQQLRAQQAAQQAAKDKPPTSASELLNAHLQRSKPNLPEARRRNLLANLRKSLPSIEDLDDNLALAALEAADFNEPLARRFIEEMQPLDEALFTQRYQIPTETKPDVIAFPCKAIQKGEIQFMSMVSNENVYIDRKVIECDHALALLKIDAATFTQDDFPVKKLSHRLGQKLGLRHGPVVQQRQESLHRVCLRSTANHRLRKGSGYKDLCTDQARQKPNTRAQGRNELIAKGRDPGLARGHNPSLSAKIHPFFLQDVKTHADRNKYHKI